MEGIDLTGWGFAGIALMLGISVYFISKWVQIILQSLTHIQRGFQTAYEDHSADLQGLRRDVHQAIESESAELEDVRRVLYGGGRGNTQLGRDVWGYMQGASAEASEADRQRELVARLREGVPRDVFAVLEENVALRHQNENYAEALREYGRRMREQESLLRELTVNQEEVDELSRLWNSSPDVDRLLDEDPPLSRTELLLRDDEG